MSQAQRRYLQSMYAQRRELETGCDCPGCDTCKGFVRNCTCDEDLTWYRIRHGQRTEVDNRTEETNSGQNMDLGAATARTETQENEFPF